METATVELDYRRGVEIEVSLLWRRHTDQIIVTVRDNRTGGLLEIPVAPEQAMHAFQHPYAYAASVGIDLPARTAPTSRVDVVD